MDILTQRDLRLLLRTQQCAQQVHQQIVRCDGFEEGDLTLANPVPDMPSFVVPVSGVLPDKLKLKPAEQEPVGQLQQVDLRLLQRALNTLLSLVHGELAAAEQHGYSAEESDLTVAHPPPEIPTFIVSRHQ